MDKSPGRRSLGRPYDAAHLLNETLDVHVEDVDVTLLPKLALHVGGLPLDGPGLHAVIVVLSGTSRECPVQVLQDDPQVPVSQAIAQKEEAALPAMAVEHGRDGLVGGHARQEVDVIVLGNYEAVPLAVDRDDAAVHLVDDSGPAEIDVPVQFVRIDGLGLRRTMRPPKN